MLKLEIEVQDGAAEGGLGKFGPYSYCCATSLHRNA
jgi:hypothetical protein